MPLNEKARPLQFLGTLTRIDAQPAGGRCFVHSQLLSRQHAVGRQPESPADSVYQRKRKVGLRPFLQVKSTISPLKRPLWSNTRHWQKGKPPRALRIISKPGLDGTHRTRESWFEGHQALDGLSHGGFSGFIGKEVTLSPEFKQRAALMAGLLDWYGTVWTSTGQYIDYFVSAPENILIGEFVGLLISTKCLLTRISR